MLAEARDCWSGHTVSMSGSGVLNAGDDLTSSSSFPDAFN